MELPSGEKASYNFFRVLRSIWMNSGVSRTELAAVHGLDKTTISQIVSELTDAGIVRVMDIDTRTARPGRKAELLSVDAGWGMVAGIEMRPDGINIVAADLHGAIIASHHHKQHVDRSNLRDALLGSLEALKADDRCADFPLVGCGVGVTGIVHRRENTIYQSIPLNIQEPFDFADEVTRHLPVPTLLDNDANCCAWGEVVSARGKDPVGNLLFVLLEFRTREDKHAYGGDVALGLGFVFNGKVYFGSDGSAGEFRSLQWHAGNTNQFSIPDEQAARILDQPDILGELVAEIAQHVALFVNTLNLKAVYVGGDVMGVQDSLLPAIRDAVSANWAYRNPVNCIVEVATHPRDMVAAGAAAMLLEHIFGEPEFPGGVVQQQSIWRQVLSGRANSLAAPTSAGVSVMNMENAGR